MWMKLLQEAVAASSKQQVANTLGVSRSAISLIMNGKYPASNDHIAKKVISVYGRVNCPHLGIEITPDQCKRYRDRPAPTSSPREMKHWRACQTCNQNSAHKE